MDTNNMSETDRYVQEEKESGFRVVDKCVRVKRAAYTAENGWGNNWHPNMYDIVGKIGIVKSWNVKFGSGIRVSFGEDEWWLPYFILEDMDKTAASVSNNKYPHKCPFCGSPAYIGFIMDIECTNCPGKLI